MSKPLMQVEYKGNPIVEQLIVKQNLYIIVRNKNNGKYILYHDNKKVKEGSNPNELTENII